ncbi:MAG TPA: glycosyltransferase [Rhodocyclaceae bacterium]|nr:glycosyltransferase [Rhodocyclaceae bacterium]
MPLDVPKPSPVLSLVIPVYNVAPFLDRFLGSIVAQDLDGMEVIVVDDGSTDACPEILARYAASCPRMRVIRQENGGLSAARNTGIDHARGEYVAFADSDDFIEPGYYRDLLTLAQTHGLDMTHGNGLYHFEGRQADFPIYTDDLTTAVMAGREVLRKRLGEKTFLHMVWLQLYRRDFIDRLGLRFVPGLIHEDVLWTTRAFMAAQRVAYAPTPGYHYRQRVRRLQPDQLDERLAAIVDSSIHNALGLDELLADAADDPELQRLIRWQLVDGALSIFHKLRKMSSTMLRRSYYRRLRQEAIFALLWRNAVEWPQRRRIARHRLKGLFA